MQLHMAPKRVCRSCVANADLKDWIASHGESIERCSFGCPGDEVSVDLLSFAKHIDTVIRQNYSPNTNPEDGLDGEDPEKVIVTVAGVSAPIAHDVVVI